MKKMFYVLISAMLVISFMQPFFAEAADPTFASFDMVMLNYEPSPAEPGDYVDITIQATNIGKTATNNAIFELTPEFPFSLDPNQEARKEYGEVGSKKQVILEYKVRVNEQAVFGNNPLKLRYTTDGQNWLIKEFQIDVRTTEAIVVVDEITAPSLFVPGESSKVDITLKNLAEASIKDLSVKLDLSTETFTTASGLATKDLPFIPVGSGLEKRSKFLESNQEISFTYNLQTYSDAESKIYKIPVIIKYKDQAGTVYTTNEVLGVTVGAEPDLSIEIDESNLHASNGYGEINLRIVNKGLTNIRFLTARLIEGEGYEMQSMGNQIYVGDVDSDDYETVDFRAKALEENINLNVELEFKDANNKQYTENIIVPVTAEAGSTGQGGNIGAVQIIVVLAVIALIVFLIRKRKKKR